MSSESPERSDGQPKRSDGGRPGQFARPSRLTELSSLRWGQLRREKITAEIERNRRGEHTVPTWMLFLILLALLGAGAAIVVFS